MEIMEIFDTDIKKYEEKFMKAAKGREVIETDFGVDNGVYWMKMWLRR